MTGKKSSKSVLIIDERSSSSRREPSSSSSYSHASGSSSNRHHAMDYSNSSRSSSGSGAYRSSQSSKSSVQRLSDMDPALTRMPGTYKKEVYSRSSQSPVVVTHHAGGYDKNDPHPTYNSQSRSGGSSSSKRRY